MLNEYLVVDVIIVGFFPVKVCMQLKLNLKRHSLLQQQYVKGTFLLWYSSLILKMLKRHSLNCLWLIILRLRLRPIDKLCGYIESDKATIHYHFIFH